VRKGRGIASTWAGTGLGRRFRVPVIMEKSVLGGLAVALNGLYCFRQRLATKKARLSPRPLLIANCSLICRAPKKSPP
jgi:hypothetical protein